MADLSTLVGSGSVGGGGAIGPRRSCTRTTGGSASDGCAAGWSTVDLGSGGEAGSVSTEAAHESHEQEILMRLVGKVRSGGAILEFPVFSSS